ncbi:MAG: hypothetical protein M1393_09685 [Candidatus Thermoplasmatota archaeon]|nr:hypothetical protein [Candidatus Thermoplasmatota archaeon]MDA8144019.1 hypothetical protein [Thermoplasmatales archaeon]
MYDKTTKRDSCDLPEQVPADIIRGGREKTTYHHSDTIGRLLRYLAEQSEYANEELLVRNQEK